MNFYNILHLFELEEDIPYVSTYIPEESNIIEKILKGKENIAIENKWKLNTKNIIQFKVRYPEEIYKENRYFQVNIYENAKIEITLSFQTNDEKIISKRELKLINNRVNYLISKLNRYNIFNFGDVELEYSNDVDKWEDENSNTKINSMNYFIKYKSKMSETKILEILNNIKECMKIYFHKDFELTENSFRYNRLNNINTSNITDKFIYQSYFKIMEEFDLEEDK